MKKLYEYRKENQLCCQCGKQDERTLSGRTMCESCYDNKRKSRKYRDQIRFKKHECIICGKVDARTLAGRRMCEGCAEFYRNRYHKRSDTDGISE